MAASVHRPHRRENRQPTMVEELKHLSVTEITLGVTSIVALIAFLIFIVAPAWGSYGRLWERIAAGFLSIYIGVALLGVGIAAGVGVIAVYLEIASS
jgi:hypothetical protein